MVALANGEPVNPAALHYVNRLSDYLFVLARAINAGGSDDVLWQPGANRRGFSPLPPLRRAEASHSTRSR